jgi:hypothetical protein
VFCKCASRRRCASVNSGRDGLGVLRVGVECQRSRLHPAAAPVLISGRQMVHAEVWVAAAAVGRCSHPAQTSLAATPSTDI